MIPSVPSGDAGCALSTLQLKLGGEAGSRAYIGTQLERLNAKVCRSSVCKVSRDSGDQMVEQVRAAG